ncbi:protein trichome birefringence-like [Nicotiana tabacum]|uniref:Protein trichome birefringence-like n=2 Tax=Nicotiana TaxID=4085 RepID=A0A1S4A9Q9_TOBAC|nr:PREDICTED: protein trichome birefringence-like [Nicotiana sylvestris]XP_016473375.1 PREDICTED: protein trichome birefringence-like [Nicotiana tabacum]
MAETAKYAPINGGTLVTDLKTHFSIVKTKRSIACAYGFVFVFIVVTTFLAFTPNPNNSSSPWFTNIFSLSSSRVEDGTYRSHFSSIFSNLFPKSSQQVQNLVANNVPTISNTKFEQPHLNKEPSIGQKHTQNNESHDKVGVLEKPFNQSTVLDQKPYVNVTVPINSSVLSYKESSVVKNQTQSKDFDDKVGILKANQSTIQAANSPVNVNQTQCKKFDDKVGILKANQSTIEATKSPVNVNQTENSAPKYSYGDKNANGNGEKGIIEKEVKKNFTSSLVKKQRNETNLDVSVKKGDEDLVKSLLNCDFFDGNWVTDESYPLYKPGSCSLIDEQFSCFLNGRPDSGYLKMKWKPKACTFPRLNATHMLELLRGKRLAFVGDSLNRNMWESLICILRNSVKDQKKVYEEFGRHHFRTEASHSFIFEEYKCRVEFFVSPFLVQQWEVADKKGGKKETLRLDLIGESAEKYKNADIIVFNTGHWWTHEKTSLGKDYYQEGSHVHSQLNVLEAFRKALTTWGRWVDAHINPKKTIVLFRGYSASHFSGGQWNSGGACDSETEPIKNDTYLTPYPSKMTVLENAFKGMKTQVSYLNITRMSDYRKDGHPSIYRKPNLTDKERKSQWRYQDCSHWCLPGVPDAWNELLYAELLVRQHQKQHEKKS